jgi:hypothetical protein
LKIKTISSLSNAPDALKKATIETLFDEVEEETKKRAAEGKNGRGIMTSKIIGFKKWRAPWITENHVYYYKKKLLQVKSDKRKRLIPHRGATISTPCALSDKKMDSDSSSSEKENTITMIPAELVMPREITPSPIDVLLVPVLGWR